MRNDAKLESLFPGVKARIRGVPVLLCSNQRKHTAFRYAQDRFFRYIFRIDSDEIFCMAISTCVRRVPRAKLRAAQLARGVVFESVRNVKRFIRIVH
jgi:hypothetical protein